MGLGCRPSSKVEHLNSQVSTPNTFSGSPFVILSDRWCPFILLNQTAKPSCMNRIWVSDDKSVFPLYYCTTDIDDSQAIFVKWYFSVPGLGLQTIWGTTWFVCKRVELTFKVHLVNEPSPKNSIINKLSSSWIIWLDLSWAGFHKPLNNYSRIVFRVDNYSRKRERESARANYSVLTKYHVALPWGTPYK